MIDLKNLTESEAKGIVWLFGIVLILIFLGLIKLFKGNFLGITLKNFQNFFIAFFMILFIGYLIVRIIMLIVSIYS